MFDLINRVFDPLYWKNNFSMTNPYFFSNLGSIGPVSVCYWNDYQSPKQPKSVEFLTDDKVKIFSNILI